MDIHEYIDVDCQPGCEEIEPILILISKIGMHVVRSHHQQLPGVQGQPVFHDIQIVTEDGAPAQSFLIGSRWTMAILSARPREAPGSFWANGKCSRNITAET